MPVSLLLHKPEWGNRIRLTSAQPQLQHRGRNSLGSVLGRCISQGGCPGSSSQLPLSAFLSAQVFAFLPCLWISGKYSQPVIHVPINQRVPCGLSHFTDCLVGFLGDKHPPGMWKSLPQLCDSAAHTGCGHWVTFQLPWSTWDTSIPWRIQVSRAEFPEDWLYKLLRMLSLLCWCLSARKTPSAFASCWERGEEPRMRLLGWVFNLCPVRISKIVLIKSRSR